MGFWHTGYAEFHESTGLDGYVYSSPPPVRYECEYCSQHFAELEALRRHRFERHPLRQPALLLRGRAVGALPLLMLTPLRPEDVVVEDATRCTLNGRAIASAELGAHLASLTREFIEVELLNDGAFTRCALDFRIAQDDHLVGVEAAFLRLARDRVLSIDAVARFIEDCRSFGTAMPYCDGICHYFYGVMAREKAQDSGLHPSQYAERYLRASEALSGFDRPISRSLRALVAFHFNQFDEAELLAPEGALRRAARVFADLLQGHSWHFETDSSVTPGSAVDELLTDQDTLQILLDARFGPLEFKERAGDLLTNLRRAPAGYDRLKRMLLASEALATRDDTASQLAVRQLARELAAHSDTSAWAEAMLKRLRTL
jgi:hypothetical protein